MKKILLPLVVLATLTACTPITANRGNFLDDYQMKEILPGVDAKDDVIRKIGSPTTVSPFNDKVWFYLGQKTEKKGILDPKIIDERIVEVTFADDGLVQTIKERKDGRKDVPLVGRTTPSSGNDYTFIQQMLGNLGKYNKADTSSAADTGGGGRR